MHQNLPALKLSLTVSLILLAISSIFAQQLAPLTIEKIMRDPKWIGVSPSNIRWSANSKKIYFNWNPENAERDALFFITTTDLKPQKASVDEERQLVPEDGNWNKARTMEVYEKYGDIWLYNLKKGGVRQLTNTTDRESGPVFSADGQSITYKRGNNLFQLRLNGAKLVQLTNFISKSSAPHPSKSNEQQEWLKKQQLELFDMIKVEAKDKKLDSIRHAALTPKPLKELVTDGRRIENLQLSPAGDYVTYTLVKEAEDAKDAIVPNYVTSSGFTEDILNRTKVGAPQDVSESFIYDHKRDSVYKINTSQIPGIKDIPKYLADYPKELERLKKLNADRKVDITDIIWSEDGKAAIAIISAQDNKDRWFMKLDPATGNLSLLNREHNDAWVGGPGQDNYGWVDNKRFYFESEASGYAHICVLNMADGATRQLTSGRWEVQTLRLSNDKKTFYFNANITHPGVSEFYRVAVDGGPLIKLTGMKGLNQVSVSPDEKWLAIRYSYTNKPWELYLQANKPGAKATIITSSASAEFNTYPWRDVPVITFKNRYGSDVYAHLYLPAKPDPAKPAVVFVHGAGYLQNVQYGWSYYFREFMFNNMLADNGYTVIDMDYSGSAGYGRDWRTAIYRHMGGKDLTDQVDGVKMLAGKYGINPANVGLYGGSYGGFITLMAMFTEPDVFKSGAAIRSVTDWAHYNHGYTDAILNEPYTDEKAYRASSPIYFADGLKGSLLMLHGMIDQNVNYQDIIRLTQRLIELHKDNWSLASYPVEDHAFEQPSSWADEYKRIYKLFEETLKSR